MAAVPTGVGDAVGVPAASWHVAIVKNNTERVAAERLRHLGYETYVAAQPQTRQWRNGKRRTIMRVVLPSLVFVRCTERERLEAVKEPCVSRFMTDRAASGATGRAAVATIPQQQMDRLMFMLGQSDVDVDIIAAPLRHGDKVKVTRGSLAGLRGEVIDVEDGKGRLLVDIGPLGCATLRIDIINLTPES